MPTIITSQKDIAGMTIFSQLQKIREITLVTSKTKDSESFKILKTHDLSPEEQYHILILENDHLHADFIEHSWKDDYFVFLSRHSAKSGIPSLTVHFTGNWNDNTKFGGKPRQVSMTFPEGAKHCFLSLNQLLRARSEFKSLKFQVTYEVTHHGPLLTETPSFFVELGSEIKQWKNEDAARALAITIDKIAKKTFKDQSLPFLGVGGTHYAEKFNQIAKHTEYAPAHLIPKYLIESVTPKTFQQALTRNPKPITAVIIDHSGTNSRQRQHLKKLLETIDDPPPVFKAKDILSKQQHA